MAERIHLLPLNDTELWATKVAVAAMLQAIDGATYQSDIQRSVMEAERVALKAIDKKLINIKK